MKFHWWPNSFSALYEIGRVNRILKFFLKNLNATGNYRKPSDKIKVVAQMTGNWLKCFIPWSEICFIKPLLEWIIYTFWHKYLLYFDHMLFQKRQLPPQDAVCLTEPPVKSKLIFLSFLLNIIYSIFLR